MSVISLYNILEKIFNYSQTFKLYFIKEFFTNMKNYLEKKFDLYIDYETSDPSYAEEKFKQFELISQKIYQKYFIEKMLKNIIKNKK